MSDAFASTEETITEAFKTHVNKEEGDIGEQLFNFFLAGAIHEKSKLMSTLKFIAHDVVAPSIHRLRETIFDKFPYMGVNQSWEVQYFVDDEEVTFFLWLLLRCL